MYYTDLSESQLKQCINAEQALQVWQHARQRAHSYRGGMVWRTRNGTDYLVKTAPDASQRGIGVRSAATQQIYDDFKAGKAATEAALAQANTMVLENERMNKALRVGRCPNIVIAILSAIRRANLAEHFMVIGTNALYAYEAQAGVRFLDEITATLDLDFLWDSRKAISLVASPEVKKDGLIGILQKADPSFSILRDQPYRAANAAGFIVDLVKRRKKSLFDENEREQLFPNEHDFWAVKIHNMDWLLSAPKFRQVVIGVNGKFAEMIVPDPRAFVLFKAWMSRQESREPQKKPRDIKQAKAVAELIADRMPQLRFEHLHVFPEALRQPFGA